MSRVNKKMPSNKKHTSSAGGEKMAVSDIRCSGKKINKSSEATDIVDVVDEIDEKSLAAPITAPEDLKEMELMNPASGIIDRLEENRDVIEFQKTGDLVLLEKVYKNRIPTIRTWANKHYYPGLISSVEDLFEELSFVFVKAAEKYDSKRGSFNTCLFTFLLNRIKNLKNSKHAKKRVSEEYDGPISGMILSLDYSYNDSEGSEITLKDVIPSPSSTHEKGYILSGTYFDETINMLSHNNPVFKGFLVKISEGGSLASLLKEYKTKKGNLKIDNGQAKKLGNRSCRKAVEELIKDNGEIQGAFKLLSYKIENSNNLVYEVEMKKTPETDRIMKTIRDLRRNKNSYISKIRGNRQLR